MKKPTKRELAEIKDDRARAKTVRAAKARVDKMKADTKAAVEATQKENADAYELTARRVIAAVEELNEAMKEAHKNPEMRVEFWPDAGDLPRTYSYRIYKLSHAVMKWSVKASKNGKEVEAMYVPVTRKPPPEATATGGDLGDLVHEMHGGK